MSQRKPAIAALFILLVVSLVQVPAFGQTSIEIDGEVYGARPSEKGPIGGGPGYQRIVTSGTRSATTLDELVAALAEAKSGDIVFLPGDVVIDLTARIYIEKLVLEVPAGVTLASDRGADRSGAPSAGALLTSDALDTPVAIRALGPDVRVSGIRLRGPNSKRYIEHHARSLNQLGDEYRDYYYKFPTSNGIVTEYDRLEVDNCEISGFSHAGVYLREGASHHVHHASIHHCQYQGLGYGVCHNRATSLIERCLFNFNRHSIAGTGRPPCGYVARHNVELGESLSHCFDMHGGRDRGDGTNVAGTQIEIYNNTFRASARPVKIRGVPEKKCEIHHNWFVRHGTAAEAAKAEERSIVHDNAYGDPAVNPH